MGGSAGRLAPRPRRQDAAQEEDGVQEEDDGVRSGEGGKETVWEQKEEEVAAVVCSGPGPALSPAQWTRRPDLAPGCRRSPPTRWTCSKLGGNSSKETFHSAVQLRSWLENKVDQCLSANIKLLKYDFNCVVMATEG